MTKPIVEITNSIATFSETGKRVAFEKTGTRKVEEVSDLLPEGVEWKDVVVGNLHWEVDPEGSNAG